MGMPVRYLVCTDLETTGTKVGRHEIIQIGRVIVDLTGPSVMPETLWTKYVIPSRWQTRDPEAMKVNKLSRETLNREGVPLRDALMEFGRGISWGESVLAAWGTDFEMKFLEAAFVLVDRVNPIPYRSVDIRSAMFFKMLDRGKREFFGLREACEFMPGLSFEADKAHDAGYDALKTAELAVEIQLL